MNKLVTAAKSLIRKILYRFRNPTKSMFNRLARQELDERQVDGYVNSFEAPEIGELLDKVIAQLSSIMEANEINTVLDAGCGTGRYLRAFHECFPDRHYFGFDFSRQTVENYCRKQDIGAKFAVGDLLKSNPWPGKRFDLVYSITVLQYIDPVRIDQVIRHFSHAQEHGSILYLCFPYDPDAAKESHLGYWWHRPSDVEYSLGEFYEIEESAPLDETKAGLGWVVRAKRK